jgi:hypothetical protein
VDLHISAAAAAASNVKPQVIKLDVGGKRFTTYLSTLLKHKDSMLYAMFAGMRYVSDTFGLVPGFNCSLDLCGTGPFFGKSGGGWFVLH